MAKKKKLLPGLAECMKPMDSSRRIAMYICTHCNDIGHDKVYIFVVVNQSKTKKKFLVRFWGKYGATLTGMHGIYDQAVFQKLIDEKGTEKYQIVDNPTLDSHRHIWGEYAREIAEYVKTVSSDNAGTRTTLS